MLFIIDWIYDNTGRNLSFLSCFLEQPVVSKRTSSIFFNFCKHNKVSKTIHAKLCKLCRPLFGGVRHGDRKARRKTRIFFGYCTFANYLSYMKWVNTYCEYWGGDRTSSILQDRFLAFFNNVSFENDGITIIRQKENYWFKLITHYEHI